ncbi:hypothetical protein BJ508DRAFT_327274 [Ascobolus immersus RN42]|uniref:Uncharacterized protein n=1 Tax=Ascobolus immersus RN42 TaxID=1160509 RepID=A0A3N4I379_ASCIM|nr:hypothetical protein BJ508DRAFT_327274 [Ascobolus immersus RN42]
MPIVEVETPLVPEDVWERLLESLRHGRNGLSLHIPLSICRKNLLIVSVLYEVYRLSDRSGEQAPSNPFDGKIQITWPYYTQIRCSLPEATSVITALPAEFAYEVILDCNKLNSIGYQDTFGIAVFGMPGRGTELDWGGGEQPIRLMTGLSVITSRSAVKSYIRHSMDSESPPLSASNKMEGAYTQTEDFVAFSAYGPLVCFKEGHHTHLWDYGKGECRPRPYTSCD